MADGLKHPPDLLIAALMQCDFIPGILAALQKANRRRSEALLVDVHSAPKPLQIALVRLSGHLYVINLRYGSGLRHEFREFAVVRKNDQTFRAEVEPSHRIKAFFDLPLHVIDNRRTLFRVRGCRHHVLGLIQKDIQLAFGPAKLLSVDFDDIVIRVGF